MLPLALRGVSRRARGLRADRLLDAAALRERGDALPGELSGGERVRLALCAALAHDPAILLADEPTGELDRAGAEMISRLIIDMARAARTSVIIASHDATTTNFVDRAVGMRDGRIVEEHRGDRVALVVGRSGSLTLPSQLRLGTGIHRRAQAEPVVGGALLRPVLDEPQSSDDRQALPAPAAAGWSSARVELRSLTRRYGRGRVERTVLDRLDHAFAPGRLTVVTGRSGTGKTTLLRLIAGLDRPDGGELLLVGQPLNDRTREQLAALRRQRIGYMPQEPTTVGFLSARENVVLALRIRGWPADAAARRATSMLTAVGLGERAGQRVFRLSAGEIQRVALARALAGARGLLVVDEPTSRLDEANAAGAATLLARAALQDGQTVICSSHDPAVIAGAGELLRLDQR